MKRWPGGCCRRLGKEKAMSDSKVGQAVLKESLELFARMIESPCMAHIVAAKGSDECKKVVSNTDAQPLKLSLGIQDGLIAVSFGTDISWFADTPESLREFFEQGVALCDKLQREEEPTSDEPEENPSKS